MARDSYTPVGVKRAAEVISLGPSFKSVPVPDLPLKDVALAKYNELAQAMLASGKLNYHVKALCEQAAVLHAQNHKNIEYGRVVSAITFDKIDRIYRELKLIDDSDAAAPESEAKENRFARYGSILGRGAKKAAVRAS